MKDFIYPDIRIYRYNYQMEEFNSNPKSREEFLAQFEDTSTEITVMIRCAWDKGNGPFLKVGNESLAYVDFILPWLATEQHPFGRGGQIWWFCKRRILGYPYPPHLKRKTCYKLRVRRSKTDKLFYYLEDIIEKDVDIAKDDSIYESVKQRMLGRYTGASVELMFYNIENVDMSKVKSIAGMGMSSESAYFSAIKEEGSEKPLITDGGVLIPVDDRDFAKNKEIRFKAGKIYRVRARQINQEDLKVYAIEELLEKEVDDKELAEFGRKALEPVKYIVDGIGEFTISDDIDATERKVFAAIADDVADKDSNIEIWDDEGSTISKEDMDNDGNISVGGLMG